MKLSGFMLLSGYVATFWEYDGFMMSRAYMLAQLLYVGDSMPCGPKLVLLWSLRVKGHLFLSFCPCSSSRFWAQLR